MALGQAILVASEAAPGLPRLCVRSSVGANVEWGSRSHRRHKPPAEGADKLDVSLTICGSHVEVFSTIQVNRFCEMFQGIKNIPIY